MNTLVEMLATIVVAMAAAALSLFGVKVQADHAPPPQPPPVISRTANPQSHAPQSLTPARPMIAECPLRKARTDAGKA